MPDDRGGRARCHVGMRWFRRLFSAAVPSGLEYCPMCRSSMVCPVAWETDGDSHWVMELRCGECGVRRVARVTNDEAKAYDLALGAQMNRIKRALRRIEHERMKDELEALVGAFERDLIDAGDFARGL